MTNIEKKACAFLMACFMCVSVIVPSFAETAYAEEITVEPEEDAAASLLTSDAQGQDEISDLSEPVILPASDEGTAAEGSMPAAADGIIIEDILVEGPENAEIENPSTEGTAAEPEELSTEGEETESEASSTEALTEGVEAESEELSTELALEEEDFLTVEEVEETIAAGAEPLAGDWSYQVVDESKKTARITGYAGTAAVLEIPSVITVPSGGTAGADTDEVNYTVVQIGQEAFANNTALTGVTIPSTVTALQYGAFAKCSSLRNVSFAADSELQTIEGTAFQYDAALESFTCPAGVKLIGDCAFAGTKGLAEVALNDALEEIGVMAFTNSGVQSIRIPNKVKAIRQSTFAGCTELSAVTLGSGIQEIEESAFGRCGKLTEITLPDGLLSIGKSAFYSCGLRSIDIPDSVTSIDVYAFWQCTALANVRIGNGLTYVANSAFRNTGLQNLAIGNKVKKIDNFAFAENQSITSVVIPDNVTDLQYKSFVNCSNLASITLPDTIEHLFGEDFHGTAWYNSQPEGEVYLGKAFYYYKGAMPANTTLTIREGTRCIAGYSCADQANLTSVILPEGLISIGDAAFLRTGLKSLYIPASVVQIEPVAVGYTSGSQRPAGTYSVGGCQVDPEFVIYGYEGTTAQAYANSNGIQFVAMNRDIAGCSISGVLESYVYTGSEITPEISVTNNGIPVSADNYTVSYKNNIEAGIATVTVTGKGILTGTAAVNFAITAAPITQCTIEGLSDRFDYTGKTIKPAVTVKLGSVTVPSTNYTVTYKNNKKVGKATATITGQGALSGSVTINFVIQPKITLKKTSYSKTTGSASFNLNAKASGKAVLKYSSSNKKVATVSSKGVVTIKGAGKAVITVSATLSKIKATKSINLTVKPAKMAAPKLTAKKKTMTVSWKKASGITGYQIQYSTSKKFTESTTKTVTVKKASQVKKSIKGLAAKTYYVRIRAYGRDSMTGSWSKTAKVKVK
ncbi:MAG: leucine-rich repeat protein [Lachnospiraceae bacterium]|nr:leucine-rich repeat protein [Lachnospiraceae bacterium]